MRTEAVEQHAVYFDTSDLRLTRSGVSLRYRSDDGWTVKLPESRTASSMTRTEHAFAGDAGPPPAPAASLVRPWSRTAPLVEIATIDTQSSQDVPARRARRSAGRGRRRRGDGHEPRSPVGTRFREIEIELAEQTPDAFLDEVVRTFRKAGAEPTRAESKIARVLGAAAAEPPDVPDEPLAREQGDRRRPRACRVRSMPAAVARVRSRDPAQRRRRGGSQSPGRDPSTAQRPAHVATDARSRLERTTPRGAQVAGIGVGRGARRRRPARRARARGRAAPGRASRCRRAAAGPAANGTIKGS